MSVMMDACCERCGRHVGWRGGVLERPPCPRCGHRPAVEQLQADHAIIEEARRLMASRPSRETCLSQRIASGLTRGQAAPRLGLTSAQLADYEHGHAPLPDDVAARMGALYGCGEEQNSAPPAGGPS